MTSPIASLWGMDTVTVEPFLGYGSQGDRFGPAVPLVCSVDYSSALVTTGDGKTIEAKATLGMAPGLAAGCPLGSRVTLPGGAVGEVQMVNQSRGGNAPFGSLLDSDRVVIA